MSLTGAHIVLYSENAEADRRFFRDVLSFPSVDAGGGWLIFALPPSEMALHPAKGAAESAVSFFLTCDNLRAAMKGLKRKNVKCRLVGDEPWGKVALITLPSGKEIGLYEPKHPRPRG